MKQNMLLMLLIGLLASCVKEEPGDNIGAVVFSVKGTIDGKPLSLEAGNNNYYLATAYTKDSTDVVTFSGNLAPKSCSSCGPAISLSMRNYTDAPAFSIDSALFTGSRGYWDGDLHRRTRFLVSFIRQAEGNSLTSEAWSFGTQLFTIQPNNVSAIYYDTGATAYNVTYTVSSTVTGCNSSINDVVTLTPSSAFDNQYLDFKENHITTRNMLFNSIPVDNSAQVSWDFGDGDTASGSIVTHQYDTGSIYRVCMTYRKGADMFSRCKNVSTMETPVCLSNFAYKITRQRYGAAFLDISIDWTDAQGHKYSSTKATRDPSDYFTVLESSDYARNEQGKRTRRIKARFSCTVSDGINSIVLKDVEAVMAVAYPD